MGVLKLDHIGLIVEDLEAAERFFLDLGLEREGGGTVEGAWVDAVVGLDGVRNEIAIMRTPDGHGRVELIRVDAPPGGGSPEAAPPNRPGLRTVAFEVDDVRATVAGLRERGFDLVGELADFEDVYRLCYVRGPEGIIVMLAESLTIGRGNGQR